MKRKWIFRVLTGLCLVLIVAFVVLAYSLGSIVKKTVERIGPAATKVDVKLQGAEVWLFACRAQLTEFVLGNPPGCKTPEAITAGSVSVRFNPMSLFSDKLVVESIRLKDPVITLEGGLKHNNLTTIEKNLDDYVNSSSNAPKAEASAPGPPKPERKLQVNDLEIIGAKLQVNMKLTGGKTIVLNIPEIHLTGLGTSPEGITAAEVGQQALNSVLNAAVTAITENAGGVGGGAVNKVTDAIKGLFH